jgi:hypothetical protein
MPRKFSATRQSDFVGRGALDVDGDREPLTIGDGHDLRALAPLRLSYGGSSLLGGGILFDHGTPKGLIRALPGAHHPRPNREAGTCSATERC